VSSPVLQLTGITKSFGGVHALNDVTLEVTGGEVHALLGENGAGKSTLMAIAAGALSPGMRPGVSVWPSSTSIRRSSAS